MLIRPLIERTAGTLRARVGADRLRRSAEATRPIVHARHARARDAMIDDDIDGFPGEVIGDREALETPTYATLSPPSGPDSQ